jgi:hypothetical protein
MKVFTGIKDTDRQILLNIQDDKELLNICSLNRYTNSLCDDNFFLNRMIKKYPQLQKRKPEKLNWKKFYLESIYYIEKLKEKYQFDFLPTSEDPKEYYNFFLKYDNLQLLLENVAKKGWFDIIKHFENNNRDELEYIDFPFITLASVGNKNLERGFQIFKYLENKYDNIENLI